MKSNFVVIVRNGESEFGKIKELCKNEPFIEWYEGSFCIIGKFDEEDLGEYEYYPLTDDWQTLSGFHDRIL